MSEWNYTKCTKPFESEEDALQYMQTKDFAGYVLKRDRGYAAVCPAYPEGFYPDAKVDQEIRRLLLYPLSYEGRIRILTGRFP